MPHSSITRALEGHRLPPKALNTIASLYRGMQTRYRTAEGLTDSVPIDSGVRQGCPLSPIVFNLTLEVVLRMIQRTGEGVTMEQNRVCQLAYADDIALLTDSPAGMRHTALAAGEAYQHLGIPTGYETKRTPTETLRDLIADTRSIDQSLLAPWQKLDAVRTFLLPRLDFILQGAHIEKDYLTEADKIIKKLAKS